MDPSIGVVSSSTMDSSDPQSEVIKSFAAMDVNRGSPETLAESETTELTEAESSNAAEFHQTEAVRSISSYFSEGEAVRTGSQPSEFDFVPNREPRESGTEEKRRASLSNYFTMEEAPAYDPFAGLAPMEDEVVEEDETPAPESACWLPSEATRTVLSRLRTSTPGAFEPEADHLTRPEVLLDEPLGDPLVDMMERKLGLEEARSRKVLSVNDVRQDVSGLKRLVMTENYRAALVLTGRLLKKAPSSTLSDTSLTSPRPTTKTLRLWTTRFTLFTKTLLFDAAEAEMAFFQDLDRPDLYEDFRPLEDDVERLDYSVSIVPFTLRLLWATLPSQVGHPEVALDRLFSVIFIVQSMIGHLENGRAADGSNRQLSDEHRRDALCCWRRRSTRTKYAIVNVLLLMKDVENAVKIYDEIAETEDDLERRATVWAGVGRLLLLNGNVTRAATYFTKAEEASPDVEVAIARASHGALLSVGAGKFPEALVHFQEALALRPDDPVIVNNLAVCLVYAGRLREALAMLQNLVETNPKLTLHDNVVFNLATLYELESSKAKDKKTDLLRFVAMNKGDGFNVQSLKVT